MACCELEDDARNPHPPAESKVRMRVGSVTDMRYARNGVRIDSQCCATFSEAE